jgi:hypothetical protein
MDFRTRQQSQPIDTNAPVNTTAETLRDKIEDALLNHRIAPAPELLSTLETLADEAAYPAAADMLAALIGRLDVRQRHLWTALLNQGDALAVIAADVGVSPQAMHRQVDRLRKRLMPRPIVDESNTASGPCRPNQIQTRSKGRRAPKPAR